LNEGLGDGHALDPDYADIVPGDMRDRMLSLAEAGQLIRRLSRATLKRPPAPSVQRRRARERA
jgi:hypothetical protein